MIKTNFWETYHNGDYLVHINTKNGTKIIESAEDDPHAAFAENCDVTISTKCDENCSFCYLNCSPNGQHANLLAHPFLYHLHPWTEMALNGNDLDHPQLIPFLKLLKKQHVLANITVNQNQFMRNTGFLHMLYHAGLIHGIGISAITPNEIFYKSVETFPTAVIHVIAGLTAPETFKSMAHEQLKILILGYKSTGRGANYLATHKKQITSNMMWLKQHRDQLEDWFSVVSFDNKAIEQLNMKELLIDEMWNHLYMGDDGISTFYIDLVHGKYGINSTTKTLYDIGKKNIDEMFSNIRQHQEDLRAERNI